MTSAERLKEYEDLFARSQAYNPAQFQAGFEKDYGEATNYNKDLIDQRAAVVGEMQSLPAQLRAQYATSGIRNPLEQEALIAQRRGTQTADLNRLTDFLQARGSKYEDVLGKYLQGYLADQSAAERAAENAWRMYQDAMAQDQYREQMELERQKLARSGSGGGIDLSGILEAFLGGGEVKDTRSPQQKVMDAINDIKQLRQTQNIEKDMNTYHKRIMSEARGLGLNLDPSALWVWLGNTNKAGPFTPILFK